MWWWVASVAVGSGVLGLVAGAALLSLAMFLGGIGVRLPRRLWAPWACIPIGVLFVVAGVGGLAGWW